MSNVIAVNRSRFWFGLGLVVILMAAFLLQVRYLLWGDWTYDQGFYFVVARLMSQGFTPYSEIHMSEQPLMVLSTYWPYRIFDSIWGMQLLMVLYAMVGVAALMAIGYRLAGRAVALWSGFLLGSHFLFFQAVHTVNPETTSISMGLAALALALHYRHSGRAHWLWLSAIAMAASFLLKLFMVVLVPLILMVLILPPGEAGISTAKLRPYFRQHRRRILRDGIIWLGILASILLISWLSVGFSNWLEQTVFFYINRNTAHVRDLAFNLSQIGELLLDAPLLSGLAVWGLGHSIFRFRQFGWLVLVWTGLTVAFLLTFTPLRDKHLLMALPLLALLAGLGLSHLSDIFRAGFAGPQWVKLGGRIALIIVGLFLVREIALPFERLSRPIKPLVEEADQPIVDMLAQFTAPGDCIITDDPYIAFEADRMPPPWLSNMSYARFDSGSIDMQAMIEVTNQSGCQAVVPTLDRIKNANRPYYDWAKANFMRIWIVDGHEIMLGKPLSAANPTIPGYANFSEQVEFVGADWRPAISESGERYAHFSLYWKNLKPFDQNYKIFVQLRDEAGQTVVSADHELFDGLVPMTTWPVEAIIKDTNRLRFAEMVPPGPYSLFVGMYDPATGERLPINEDASGENAVVIPALTVP